MGWPDSWRASSYCLAMIIQREWMWFIANFCMLANGAYIATAWLSGDRYLDTPKLLEHGASPISVALYCLLTIGFGYVGFRRSCVSALSVMVLQLANSDDQVE